MLNKLIRRFRPDTALPPAELPPQQPIGALIAGHSHIIAMQGAADLLRDEGQPRSIKFLQLLDADVSPNIVFENNEHVLGSGLQARLRGELAANPKPTLFLSVSGNEYHFMGLVNHPRRFDFVLDSAPDLPIVAGAEIIAYDLVRASLKASMEHALTILGSFSRGVQQPFWQIQSPPPVSSNEEISAHPQQFAAAIEQYGVAPAFFRLKLWRLQSEIYREHCDTLGINYLPVPQAALDADGFMRPEGWHHDPTHANYWYGRLVLDQIEAIAAAPLSQSRKAP